MRIWSLHPKYLDSKGLVALWRESLLAKHVLEGQTKGYINHPQLDRFKDTTNPLDYLNFYLQEVWRESKLRNYNFNQTKFSPINFVDKIPVTKGQIAFEQTHLVKKLKQRDLDKFVLFSKLDIWDTHPIFYITEGGVEQWERV